MCPFGAVAWLRTARCIRDPDVGALSVALPRQVKIIISAGKEDVVIKISDEGGGIPRSASEQVWDCACAYGCRARGFVCARVCLSVRAWAPVRVRVAMGACVRIGAWIGSGHLDDFGRSGRTFSRLPTHQSKSLQPKRPCAATNAVPTSAHSH
jgi:hypothetical protein